ncbi:hypothetical protein D3C86_1054930 [compost metagenome]
MLAGLVLVSFWRIKRRKRFYIKQTVFRGFKIDLVNDSSWNDQVVAVFERDISHHGTERSFSFVDENHLIGIGIFIEVIT